MSPRARPCRSRLLRWCLQQSLIQAALALQTWALGPGHQEHCQVILTSGYGYRQFIPLEAALAPPGDDDPMAGYPAPDAPRPMPTPPPPPPPGGNGNASTSGTPPPLLRLVLRFQVMAESDAHILLSAQRRSDREAYEVVIGAGNNTYTDFRRLPASLPPRRAFNYSTGVVSGEELRAFWLLADLRTGVLAVGPAGGPPILAWVDPEPLHVRYISLCTWTDVEGTWLYGCEREHRGEHPGSSPSSGVLDAEWMTPADRLHQHVLALAAHKKSPPRHQVNVSARLDVHRFVVDDRLGVLTIFGMLVTDWQDERLTWTPSDYDGLNATALASPTSVWLPHLHAASPVHSVSAGLMGGAAAAAEAGLLVHLHADGHLRALSPVKIQAHCLLERGGGGGGAEDFLCDFGVTASPPVHLRLAAGPVPPPMGGAGAGAGAAATGWTWAASEADERAAAAPGNDTAQDTDTDTAGADAASVRIRLRYTGSRTTGVFLATYIAACACCVLGLLEPLLVPGGGRPRGPRGLFPALTLLMTAVAMLSLQAALPPAVLAAEPSSVLCLSAALAVSAAGLLLQTLPAAAVGPEAPEAPEALMPAPSTCAIRLPQLPRALNKVLRSPSLARILLCSSGPSDRPRWRACPSGTPTDRVLEMLDAMDAEEARRDWHILAVVLERVAAVLHVVLVLAAIAPTVARTS
ncbi:5-hydroxytryptamine receptor 3A [Frankliniella fusca]|uniref:5-hydroxytryptamine receptor 3A n=1 Tax=Frankliniella fusca TaxID=407009 RepID=A0AAE1HQV0_9NEOP|nr:5-hydroxytryptamine receptor 3A [Frankliniella fusca]